MPGIDDDVNIWFAEIMSSSFFSSSFFSQLFAVWVNVDVFDPPLHKNSDVHRQAGWILRVQLSS